MKKLMSLLVMVIFMTGMVVAQNNNATANQNGDKNSAGQTQAGSSNTATVDQNTPGAGVIDGQTATQLQEGENNTASIEQNTWGANAEGNTAVQEQYGKNNAAASKTNGSKNSVTQIQGANTLSADNKSSLYVGGSMNVVEVHQDGMRNEANGQLLGDDDNYVNVDQDGNDNMTLFRVEYGDGNVVNIDQVGDQNTVGGWGDPGVHIWGSGNDVDINQFGNQEKTEIGLANDARVFIEGDGNKSVIQQEGQYNQATHTMQGSPVNGNVAETRQDGYNNIGEITQESDNNIAYQMQDAYAPADNILVPAIPYGNDPNNEADENESYITQKVGTGNVAKTFQFGDKNIAHVLQEGAGNILEADQGIWDQRPAIGQANHGLGNMLEVKVKGDQNQIFTVQDGLYNTMKFDLYSESDGSNNRNIIDKAYQLGGENSMKVTVKGDDNTTFDFDQLGHGNVIQGLNGKESLFYEGDMATDFTIYQEGIANTVDGEIWHGKGIDLNINQSGYNNYSELDIKDWNNVIDIDQVSPAGTLVGDRNEAFIYQRGGSNGAFVNQNGTGNTANIHQTH